MLNIFKVKPTYIYRFILKSGATITFKCSKLNYEFNSETLLITSYNVDNVTGERPIHVIPSEIIAIVRLK